MVNLLIAGDFCPNSRVKKLIDSEDYNIVFENIKPIVNGSGYSVLNLECTIVSDENTSPIDKCGPNLKQSPKVLDSIKFAGFNCVTLANNHFSDFGHEGAIQTLRALENAGLDYVGGGKNLSDAAKILYKKINGHTLAVVNFCENEFTIATSTSGGANPLNPVDNFYKIQEAKRNANYVIVIIHGGPEHYQLPTPRMQKTYRFFVDAGADVVVNHHQHCYSGYEIYKEKLIFYGLGNFCFDIETKRNDAWNEGFMLTLSFSKERIDYKLIPYKQGDTNPGIVLMKDDELVTFQNKIEMLNEIISNPELLVASYRKFIEDTSMDYINVFNPYMNKWLRRLKKRNLLPAFIENELAVEYLTKERLLNLISFIQCESHAERCLNSLKYYYNTRIKK